MNRIRHVHALLLLPILVLGACVKHRERYEVQPDGAVTVTLEAEGSAADLADGYPVSFAAPWQPAGADSLRWIEAVGPHAGGVGAAGRAEALGAAGAGKDRELRLAATATFASAAAIPATLAAPDDPYASAFLQRGARLEVRRSGGRTVYTFEKTWRARSGLIGRIWRDLFERLEEMDGKTSEPITEGKIVDLGGRLAAALERSAATFVREAAGAVYEDDAAALPLAARERLVKRTAAAFAATFPPARARVPFDLAARERGGDAPPTGKRSAAGDAYEAIATEARALLRATLASGLAGEGVPAPVQNGILHRLEWLLAEKDHTDDLADETFEVTVAMPGTVVSGNFDAAEGGEARFAFHGKDLVDRDVVLKVVSVVE